MTHDEMRFIRREIINFTLHEIRKGNCLYIRLNPMKKLTFTTRYVREYEIKLYASELQAYK